jgi:F420-dependent oxidoreductase-like protein
LWMKKEHCTMKLGLQVLRFDWPGGPANIGPTLANIARTADAAGLDSMWVMDHFYQMDAPYMGLKPEDPMLDGYTALSFAAGVTERIRLGTMVTGANYRHPGHLLKIVSALDVLSGGRAILGIGAGWYEREALGLGFPFPPLKERFERLEETLQIFKQVWAGDFSAYDGRHYHLAEPMNYPQPLSRPHPPILIGGGGEKKTLRLVAQYGDACNLFARIGEEQLSHKLNILRRHCDEVGRDYAQIEKTVLAHISLAEGGMTPAEMIAQCREFADLGFDTFMFSLKPAHDLRQLELIGREVVPAVAEF